jgi:hypothetical protein
VLKSQHNDENGDSIRNAVTLCVEKKQIQNDGVQRPL